MACQSVLWSLWTHNKMDFVDVIKGTDFRQKIIVDYISEFKLITQVLKSRAPIRLQLKRNETSEGSSVR